MDVDFVRLTGEDRTMSERTQNSELLAATMQYIEENPEAHDQIRYLRVMSCGTAGCFAGHSLLLSGTRIDPTGMEPEVEYQYWWRTPDDVLIENSRVDWLIDSGELSSPWEDMETIRDAAIARLGISEENASVLFCGSNSRERLRLMVDALIADPSADLSVMFGEDEDED